MKAGPGSGGKRKGAGRTPGWVREKCAKIVEKSELVEFLGRVAEGKEKDHRMTKEGIVIEVPASIHDRAEAAMYLIDQAGGKAPQAMQLQDEDGQPVSFAIINFKGASANNPTV